MRNISQAHVWENKEGYIEIAILLKVNQAYRDPNKKNELSAVINGLSAWTTGQKAEEKERWGRKT